MKALCTSYNQTAKGLVLRNNWVEDIRDQLEDFLSKYIEGDELKYQTNYVLVTLQQKNHSYIIEGKMELDNVVIHIRIIN